MELQMAFYETHGRTNYFLTFGQGRPILLLHGISNSGAHGAADPGPGRGGISRHCPGPCRPWCIRRLRPLGVADIADDTERLLATLGIDRLDVVGLSLGGMVALELALRHPGRIGRLVVANSFFQTTSPAFQAMAEDWANIFESPHGPVSRFEQSWPALVSPAFQNSPEGIRTYQAWHGSPRHATAPRWPTLRAQSLISTC
jgi:3-oxoadipate enol-lactonase